ncbi:6-phosphogluconolactonase [Candidatus Gottesmanbacteria bacterium]|nr:6-phosphogluconolactonase [Candidatus Gottesmanbacteria bacterium]
MNIYSHSDIHQVAENAGRRLSEEASKTKSPLLLLLSGGSSLDVLNHVDVSLIDTQVTIGLVDERFTADMSKTNFWHLVRHPFFIPALRNGARLIDPTTGYKETIKDETDRLDRSYKRWINEHKNGSIIMTAGIGEDGHTAGIFPMPQDEKGFQERFVDTQKFAIGYDAGKNAEVSDRVTCTIPFIQKASCVIVYAVGEKKRTALKKLCSLTGKISETPARLLREMPHEHVCLFTDQTNLRYAL